MKTIYTYLSLIALCLFFTTPPATGSIAKPVMEVVEQLAKKAGRAPAKGAAEALELAYRTGGPAALKTARAGGLDLVEAAARHGDEVFSMAARVPAASSALASRAGKIVPLARRHGDDVLRIEAVAPGLADDAIKAFPKNTDLARLTKLPPADMQKVISYSAHAADDTAARTLLRAVEKKGSSVFERLNPKQILAAGLSTAMVVTAGGGAVAIASSPDHTLDKMETLAKPVTYAGGAAIIIIASILGVKLWIWLRPKNIFAKRP